MADLPISQLPLATSGQPESLMVIVNYDVVSSGETNSIYFSSLTQQFSGASGSSGTSGSSGSSGTSGSSGSSGTSGSNGSSGTSGSNGSSGTSGIDGSSGTSGTDGSSGTSGIDGSSGTSGTDGSSGTSGIDGSSGTSGFSGDLYRTTSSTPLTIQTGSTGTFVVGTNLGYSVAQDVIIAYDLSNHMIGMVVSYNPSNGDMVVNVETIIGSGLYSSWLVNLAGAAGGDGSSGTSGTSGSSGSSGIGGSSGTSGSSGSSGTSGITPSIPTKAWGAFVSDIIQSATTSTLAYAMSAETQTSGYNVNVVDNSQFTVTSAGTYNIQFSAQIEDTGNSSEKTVDIWLSIDGIPVSNSNTQIQINSNNGKIVASWNFVETLTAGQYIQIMWTATNPSVVLNTFNAQTNPTRPAVPSLIVTVTQV